ncbi:molybdopterin biosynthesis enzyme [Pelotomaculum thermopropionicum SI]|uniref:Molybdopterin molybdenumtransferase n=1 Tax=Pelotomaculum thermopropionicum (strain DSM 13744 / JCM 10971 / SI) TaxID=370438 RepID=A5CYY4_PELTS|nr:molybdopterin biosynthesis enzyme [Pelotomaculum thermopropionicum SI]
MAELFKALTVEEARVAVARYLPGKRPGVRLPLLESLGRRLAADVRAPEDVPGFDRSTVDGYAVRARDTYGATEGLPSYLDVAGEVLMGREPEGTVSPGQAWRIATGGMLPPGADAVVMLEYTEELDCRTIGVTRPVAPGENVIRKGEDIAAGEIALPAGHRIRPQDMGMLSSVGVSEVEVELPVRVGIISTGDELVSPGERPVPGQVRDINSYTLYGAVAACGGEPRLYGIVGDDYEKLKRTLELALSENDMVLLSGGSSVGTRDVAALAIDSAGEPGVLFHGISVKPGKPTIGAVVNGKPVFGLPGHPASAMVVFELMVAPLVRSGGYAAGEKEMREALTAFPLRAVLTRSLHSAAGREDFIRVRLHCKDGRLFAEPVLGKSGLISTMVKADGLARIPPGKEGVEAGEIVEVKLF